MNPGEKKNLLERLSETHSSLQETLKGVDLELRVYRDTEWRIRDILGHIATWDREVTHAIKIYLEGSEYVIPGMVGDETDYNAEKVEEQRILSTSEILQEWNQAREDFIDAVRQVPTDRLSDELAFPWGDERGSFTLMIEYMIEHNGEHQEEILKALKKTG